jgi:hypothetical protein
MRCSNLFSTSGEEIFTFYGYQPGSFPNDFPWYFDALKKVESEQREEQQRKLNQRPTGTKIKVLGAENLEFQSKLEL